MLKAQSLHNSSANEHNMGDNVQPRNIPCNPSYRNYYMEGEIIDYHGTASVLKDRRLNSCRRVDRKAPLSLQELCRDTKRHFEHQQEHMGYPSVCESGGIRLIGCLCLVISYPPITV